MISANRRYISLRVELAAALCQLTDANGNRLVSHEEAKTKTARQIRSLFECDHWPILKTHGGPDAHWNLTWRLKPEHRKKTGNDLRELAKDRSIRATVKRHKQAMLLKGKRKRGKPRHTKWGYRRLQGRKFRG